MPYMGPWGSASMRFPRHSHKRPRRPVPPSGGWCGSAFRKPNWRDDLRVVRLSPRASVALSNNNPKLEKIGVRPGDGASRLRFRPTRRSALQGERWGRRTKSRGPKEGRKGVESYMSKESAYIRTLDIKKKVEKIGKKLWAKRRSKA